MVDDYRWRSVLDMTATEVPPGNATLEFALGVLDELRVICAVLNGAGLTTPERLNAEFAARRDFWQAEGRPWRAKAPEILADAMLMQGLALNRGGGNA